MSLTLSTTLTPAALQLIGDRNITATLSFPLGWPIPAVGDQLEFGNDNQAVRLQVVQRVLQIREGGAVLLHLDVPPAG
jgi:hypothetical protein